MLRLSSNVSEERVEWLRRMAWVNQMEFITGATIPQTHLRANTSGCIELALTVHVHRGGLSRQPCVG